MEKVFLESSISFSNLNGEQLNWLLDEIDSYLINYRDNLNIDKNITFGIEMEYEGIKKRKVDEYISNNYKNWRSNTDRTLVNGGEINSPIMRDTTKNWQELKEICNYLKKSGADVYHNAGGHIHVGSQILEKNKEYWLNFLKIYILYESVIYKFSFSDASRGRDKLYTYAEVIGKKLYDKMYFSNNYYDIFEHLQKLLRSYIKKYSAINFRHVDFNNDTFKDGNTIEFRMPNATTNEIIWQNNINTFAKLVIAAKNVDTQLLDYRLKNYYKDYFIDQKLYGLVDFNKLLEFVDIIFDNNLDKINFMKQYLHSNNYGFNLFGRKRTKKFTASGENNV